MTKCSILCASMAFACAMASSAVHAQSCAQLKPNAINAEEGETNFVAEIMSTRPEKTQRVKAMLACKPDLKTVSMAGWSPLHVAAADGSDEIVEMLVKAGVDVNARGQLLAWTPLHLAAEKGGSAAPMIKALLRNGADKSVKNEDGNTAYDIALKGGELKDVLPLLKP